MRVAEMEGVGVVIRGFIRSFYKYWGLFFFYYILYDSFWGLVSLGFGFIFSI